jgi:RecA-family ATPase
MDSLTVPPIQTFEEFEAETLAMMRPRAANSGPAHNRQLDIVRAATLAGRNILQRRFVVEGMIPARTVTLLGGDGGTGKSLIALQLGFAVATSTPWLGMSVEAGPCLFIGAEDDLDETHRRLAAIVGAADIGFQQLGGLSIVCLAGQDAVMARPGDDRILTPTDLYWAIDAAIGSTNAALVIIDNLADVFGGSENERAHARQFIGLLRGMTIRHDTTILLLAHPSLTGLSSGSGTSGSTAWSNSVRSRLYLERIKDETGREADADTRVLKIMKANYTGTGSEIRLVWRDGLFVPDAAQPADWLDRRAHGSFADEAFLSLLSAYDAEGREVSAKASITYAPAVFAKDARAGGLNKSALTAAMNRLFAARRIKVEEFGPQSKRRTRIVIMQKEGLL